MAWDMLGKLVDAHGIEVLRAAADRYFGQEIPPLEFPVTRFGFSRNVQRWVAAIDNADPAWRAVGKPRRIAVAAFNLHHLQFMFAMSCILALQGHQIDFLYLPSMRFTRDCHPEPSYDSWDEKFLAAEITRAGNITRNLDLRVFDLRTEEAAAELGVGIQRSVGAQAQRRPVSGVLGVVHELAHRLKPSWRGISHKRLDFF